MANIIAWDAEQDVVDSDLVAWAKANGSTRPPADHATLRRLDERGSTDEVSLLALTAAGRSILGGALVLADDGVLWELRRKLRLASTVTSAGYVEAGGMRFTWETEAHS